MDDLIKRIALLLELKNLNYSDFADAIGIQRSMVSHIMSGRNNPSLDVVKKILNAYPDIRTDWLLTGKGAMQNESDLFTIQRADKPIGVEKTSKEGNGDVLNTQYSLESEIPDTNNEILSRENLGINDPMITSKPLMSDHHKPSSSTSREEIEQKQDYQCSKNKKSVERIVIFYTDKTFNEYFPE